MDIFYYNGRKYQLVLNYSVKGLESWLYLKAYSNDENDNFLFVTFLYNITTGEMTIDFEMTIKEMMFTHEALLNDWLYYITLHELHEPSIWQLATSSKRALFAINDNMYKEDEEFIAIIKKEISEDKNEFERHLKKAIIDLMI